MYCKIFCKMILFSFWNLSLMQSFSSYIGFYFQRWRFTIGSKFKQNSGSRMVNNVIGNVWQYFQSKFEQIWKPMHHEKSAHCAVRIMLNLVEPLNLICGDTTTNKARHHTSYLSLTPPSNRTSKLFVGSMALNSYTANCTWLNSKCQSVFFNFFVPAL